MAPIRLYAIPGRRSSFGIFIAESLGTLAEVVNDVYKYFCVNHKGTVKLSFGAECIHYVLLRELWLCYSANGMRTFRWRIVWLNWLVRTIQTLQLFVNELPPFSEKKKIMFNSATGSVFDMRECSS